MANENIGALVVRIEANLKNFEDGVGKMNSKINGFGSTVGKIGGIIAGAFVVKAIISGIKDVTNAAMESERAANRLDTLAKNVPGTTQAQIDALKTLASERQKLTTVEDDATIAGMSQLASFQMQTSTIATLTPAFQDLAVATYGANVSQEQMIQSGNLIGKVMEGNVGALSRVGVSFTDAQEKILKTGTEAEKAAALVEVLGQNFGGLAESTRNTTEGALVAMNNAWGDFKEVLGGFVLPILGKVAAWFSSKIPDIQAFTLKAFNVINPIVAKLSTIFKTEVLPTVNKFTDFIKTNMPQIKAIIKTVFDEIAKIVVRVFKIFKEDYLPALVSLYNFVKPVFPVIGAIISAAFKVAVVAINLALDAVSAYLKGAKTFIDNLRKIFTEAYNIGKNLIQGLINGMSSIVTAVVQKAKEIGGAVISAIKNVLGIASPSKIMEEIGKFVALGLAEGITENMTKAQQAAQKMADMTVRVFDKMGNAITEALRKKYQEQQMLTLAAFDKETASKIEAVQNQIDAIDGITKAEETAIKEREYQQSLASIDEQIRTEKDKKEITRLQREKADMIAEHEREKLLEQRDYRKYLLEDQIKLIQEKATKEREVKNQQFEELLKEENIQAEVRKLAVDKNNAAIIELLKTYNPQWQNAGQSFGESLLNGLNSTKVSIEKTVDSILSLVDKADAAAESLKSNKNKPTTGQSTTTKPNKEGLREYAIGTNYVPFDMKAFIHKGEAVVPANNNPSNPSANNPIGQSYNFERMFEGAQFIVRSDNDAKLIGREIYNATIGRNRGSGVVAAT